MSFKCSGVGDTMANRLTKALAGNNIDKAYTELDAAKGKDYTVKRTKRKKFTQKQLDAIKKAREELKALHGGR